MRLHAQDFFELETEGLEALFLGHQSFDGLLAQPLNLGMDKAQGGHGLGDQLVGFLEAALVGGAPGILIGAHGGVGGQAVQLLVYRLVLFQKIEQGSCVAAQLARKGRYLAEPRIEGATAFLPGLGRRIDDFQIPDVRLMGRMGRWSGGTVLGS